MYFCPHILIFFIVGSGKKIKKIKKKEMRIPILNVDFFFIIINLIKFEYHLEKKKKWNITRKLFTINSNLLLILL